MLEGLASKKSYLIGLIVLQVLCAAVFLYDAVSDLVVDGLLNSFQTMIELIAACAMIGSVVVEFSALQKMQSQRTRLERSLQIAKGKMQTVIDTYFTDWGLTPAEMDVAILAIKGFSIAEISNLRQAQEGTVKTQLTSIYKKAGVTGRNQLGSLLIEDLMGTPL